MTDADVFQDFFDTLPVTNSLNAIVNVGSFLAGRHALAAAAPNASSDPHDVLSCIKKIKEGIGIRLFRDFVTLKDIAPSEGLDDVWAHWCPSPVELNKSDYPIGAIPLWSNGEKTVFCLFTKDSQGYDSVEFGIS